MFRGGPVSSYGTGIASGLADGGRVGLQSGGAPFNVNPGARTPIPTQSTMQTGASLLDRARNVPYLRAIIPSAGGRLAAMSPFGLAALGGIGIGKTADFITRATDTPEAYAFRKEATRANPFLFDETSTDEFTEFSKKLSELDQGEKYGFFPRGGPEKRLEEMGLTGKFTSGGDKIENPLDDGPEEKTLTADQIKILELEKLIEDMTKVDPKAKESDMEESIDIDKEKFAKALGRDKARGQDISDMLLSFSSKALAPGADVKSAFAEFAADEVKRPGRVRKIDDSAAALAINKYIKGEISKQEADQFFRRAQFQSDKIAERAELTPGQAFAKSTAPTFAGRVKDAALTVFETSPKFEVVESKDMKPVEEGGKFEFSPEDIGVIFIETDTRESYTFDRNGNRIPFINA